MERGVLLGMTPTQLGMMPMQHLPKIHGSKNAEVDLQRGFSAHPDSAR
jgi:hypothetical protein